MADGETRLIGERDADDVIETIAADVEAARQDRVDVGGGERVEQKMFKVVVVAFPELNKIK